MKIMFTINVEDCTHVSALTKSRNIKDWVSIMSRVAANMHHLPDIFDNHNVKSAHFNLGWKVKVSRFSELRHYNNLDECMSRLDILLSDFSFTKMQDKPDELGLFSSSHEIEVAY